MVLLRYQQTLQCQLLNYIQNVLLHTTIFKSFYYWCVQKYSPESFPSSYRTDIIQNIIYTVVTKIIVTCHNQYNRATMKRWHNSFSTCFSKSLLLQKNRNGRICSIQTIKKPALMSPCLCQFQTHKTGIRRDMLENMGQSESKSQWRDSYIIYQMLQWHCIIWKGGVFFPRIWPVKLVPILVSIAGVNEFRRWLPQYSMYESLH